MKNIRSEIKNRIDNDLVELTRCVRIVRQDGAVFRFTDHDRTLMMSNGTIYEPNPAILPDSAITYHSDGKSASVDLKGALDDNKITRKEFVGGIWDYAKVFVFRTLWDDPIEDDVEEFAGRLGETQVGEIEISIQMQSLSKILENQIGVTTSITCRAQLGDSDCGVRLDPPEWTANTDVAVREEQDAKTGDVVKPTSENGAYFKCITAGTTGSSEPSWNTSPGSTTSDGSAEWQAFTAYKQTDEVQSVTNSRVFTGKIGFPDDSFNFGTVEFISGANKGVQKEVEDYTTDTYELWVEMPFEVNVGDQFIATRGCKKRLNEDCIKLFDNNFNFRGEPNARGPTTFAKFGGQGG